MNLIAFTGLAGCGKSTAAYALVKHRNFVRFSFAQPLRNMLRELGLTNEQLTERKMDPVDWLNGKTPRFLLQTLGTEWGRETIDPNIWVNATRRKILEALKDPHIGGVVIDDCRFPNEADMIHELGGRVILIDRPGCTRMNHASEAGVDPSKIDCVIHNSADNPSVLQTHVLYVLEETVCSADCTSVNCCPANAV